MGKGDKKTRRGKIYNGSHGKVRPRKAKPESTEKTAASPPARKTTRRHKPA